MARTSWRFGELETERQCSGLRETLTQLGGDPEVIEEAVAYLRAQREREYCRACGDYIVAAADGSRGACRSCTHPIRRPWPTSRQGYRPR